MTKRLEHYTDHALTLAELEAVVPAFAPFWVRCIDGAGTLAVKSGARYQVVGEVVEIFGRRLAPDDERWVLAETHDIPLLDQRKSRFIPEAEFFGWRVAYLSKRIDELRAEIDALEMPDDRF